MAMTPEGKVKKEIDAVLNAYGDRVVWFKPATGGYGRSGISDYVGCLDGMFFSIEAKRAGETPTTLQQRFMRSVSTAKGLALLCDGTDYIGLVNSLNSLLAENRRHGHDN